MKPDNIKTGANASNGKEIGKNRRKPYCKLAK
jgi:hypothetical protein